MTTMTLLSPKALSRQFYQKFGRSVIVGNSIAPYRRILHVNSALFPTGGKSCPLTDTERSYAASSIAMNDWRKQQLDKIEDKFKRGKLEALSIESEEDLQPMWKEMEGRVTRRKPRTLADTGGRSGRMNIKQTDEDVWLNEGLYSTADGDSSKKE